ncbi:hypothetical protein [Ensifer sp. 2TAB8]|uniref:hypothetical protein n=1 Tax=Ensifer sp. 2TAB8 TaxID=3233006 RepID=UPI003F8FD3CB
MGEFIDAYSDDQIMVELLEKLIAADPVESLTPERIIASSLSRLWATIMVGAIETMIKSWRTDHPVWREIGRYLDSGNNRDRVRHLHSAFTNFGIEIDESVFEDFLAIKCIRNTYIHGKWSEPQREFVVSRGFPGDLMQFTSEHLSKIKGVYMRILNALGTVNAVLALHASKKS